MLIRIGHGAYPPGSNELKFVRSKSAAVKELRRRGMLRNRARKIINEVTSKEHGYATEYCCAAFHMDIVEILNCSTQS